MYIILVTMITGMLVTNQVTLPERYYSLEACNEAVTTDIWHRYKITKDNQGFIFTCIHVDREASR